MEASCFRSRRAVDGAVSRAAGHGRCRPDRPTSVTPVPALVRAPKRRRLRSKWRAPSWTRGSRPRVMGKCGDALRRGTGTAAGDDRMPRSHGPPPPPRFARFPSPAARVRISRRDGRRAISIILHLAVHGRTAAWAATMRSMSWSSALGGGAGAFRRGLACMIESARISSMSCDAWNSPTTPLTLELS